MMFGVFNEEELTTLSNDKRKFPHAAAISRGGQFQPWSNGTMQAVGSRMPSGGRPGDTYTIYPGMEIRNEIDRIKRLFKHAKACRAIIHRNVHVCH